MPHEDDAPNERPEFADLPHEIVVKVCLVGIRDAASFTLVSRSMWLAALEAVRVNVAARGRLRSLFRRWAPYLHVLTYNGFCTGCGIRHLRSYKLECSFCCAPFCTTECLRATWAVHKQSCGFLAAREGLRRLGVEPPSDAQALIPLLRAHGLHHLLPWHLRPVSAAETAAPTIDIEGSEEVDPEVD